MKNLVNLVNLWKNYLHISKNCCIFAYIKKLLYLCAVFHRKCRLGLPKPSQVLVTRPDSTIILRSGHKPVLRRILVSFVVVWLWQPKGAEQLRRETFDIVDLPWKKKILQICAQKGYRDYYVDGFHFGYKIETLPSGESVVVVYEALHELLFD